MTLPTVHNTPNPAARGFDAQLDSLLLRLSVAQDRQVKITSAENQAQRIQTSEVPEEFVSEYGDVYARSDFTGGSGLDLAHQRSGDPQAHTRYWDSYGIRVVDPEPGRRRELTLLEATEADLPLTTSGVHLLWTGTELLAADGPVVRYTSNPTAASPTWNSQDPTTGTSACLRLAKLGDVVWGAFGASGLYKRAGGTWSNVYGDDIDGVWSVKSRLLVSQGVYLLEQDPAVATFSADPDADALKVLPSGQTWVDVADGGTAILAAATDGYVYAFAPNDSGVLTLAEQTRFEQETPTALGAAQGSVFVATTSSGDVGRLWQTEVDNGALVAGRVLREWDTGAPRRIIADRESIYTAVPDSPSEVHSWRYNLSTGGLHRWWIFDDAIGQVSDVYGLALIDERLFAGIDEEGVHRSLTTFPTAGGWLITPLGDFFTSEEKAWVSAQTEVGEVTGGASVTLSWTGDPAAILDEASNAWVKAIEASSVVGDTVLTAPLVNRISRYAAGLLRITPTSDQTAAPMVRSVGFRAYPEQPDIVVDLPVNVSDVVEPPGRRRVRVRGRGSELYTELQAREGRPCLLRLFRPSEVVRGVVQRVATPQTVLTRRGGQTMFSLVSVRGRRTNVTVVPAAAEGSTGTYMTGSIVTGGPPAVLVEPAFARSASLAMVADNVDISVATGTLEVADAALEMVADEPTIDVHSAEHVATVATPTSTTQESRTVSAPAAAEEGDLLVVFWWRNHASDISVPAGWTHGGAVVSTGNLKLHVATRAMEVGDSSWSWPLVIIGHTITAVRGGTLGDVTAGSNITSLTSSSGLSLIGSAIHWDSSGVTFTPSEGTSVDHTAVGSGSHWRYTAATHKTGDFAGLTFSASGGSAQSTTVHIAVEVEA